MIDFLKNWVEQIVLAVIVISIFEMIIPNGNIKKYIKVVLALYVVFCMISPFVKAENLFDLKRLETIDIQNKSTINQESTDKRLQELYMDEIKSNIKTKVKEYGYKVKKIKIDANLQQSSSMAGIHKIELIVLKADSNFIENIENIDIQINMDENKEVEENYQIEILKNELAKYYELNPNIIKIKLEK